MDPAGSASAASNPSASPAAMPRHATPNAARLALLHTAFGTGFENLPQAAALFPKKPDRQLLARMIITGLSSPWTSSTGRLFDGIAALLGICTTNGHEAQAAMALEAAAWSARFSSVPKDPYLLVRADDLWELDLSPLIRWIVKSGRKKGGLGVGWGNGVARGFHQVLAEGFVGLARAAGAGTLPLVASGGSLCNRLLERELERAAAGAGLALFFTICILLRMRDWRLGRPCIRECCYPMVNF